MLRILILGGSSEATALVHALKDRAGIEPTLSLAGRTRAPIAQAVATRLGGFGGVKGLCAYLQAERIDLLVDATHPFAAQMSRHAREAGHRTQIPLIAVGRPAWTPQPGDRWTEVADMMAAVVALGHAPRRVFLTVGRSQLGAFEAAPQHAYLVRTIDPISTEIRLPALHVVEARGPFDADAEERLMHDYRIDVLVTKNSGGTASAPKLEAARRLGVPVILIRRPTAQEGIGVDDALAVIDAQAAASPFARLRHGMHTSRASGSSPALRAGDSRPNPVAQMRAKEEAVALTQTLDHPGQRLGIGIAPAGP